MSEYITLGLSVSKYMTCIQAGTKIVRARVQGGVESYDALSCGSFFAKERLIIGLFCGE